MNKSENVVNHLDTFKRVEFLNSNRLNDSNALGMTYAKSDKLLPPLVNVIKPVVLPYKVNLPCASYTFPSIISLNQNGKTSSFDRKGWPPDFYYNQEYANGSYLKALRDARQREQRLAKDKYTSNDYKKYQNNYGFGRDFLPFETETKTEKLEKAKKREEYAAKVKLRNNGLNDNVNYGRFTNNYSDNVFVPKNNSNQNFFQQPKYKLDVDVEQPTRRKNKVK